MASPSFITPEWRAPPAVCAVSTTRIGGVSDFPYEGLNLALHVGDDPQRVNRNRVLLGSGLGLPTAPSWLTQVHSARVVTLGASRRRPVAPDGVAASGRALEFPDHTPGATCADGSVSSVPGAVCAVLTADCLPVLLCDRQGTRVAALHAGWRGLVGGILEAGVAALGGEASELLAWIGPGIGRHHYEVGAEVRHAFLASDPKAESAFVPTAGGRWQADMVALARRRLLRCGVTRVSGGHWCTYSEPARFYSYRRDGVTGRMATLIWLRTRPEITCTSCLSFYPLSSLRQGLHSRAMRPLPRLESEQNCGAICTGYFLPGPKGR